MEYPERELPIPCEVFGVLPSQDPYRKQNTLCIAILLFQLMQKMIAEMYAETEAMRRMLYTVCYEYDHGNRSNTLASAVKLQLPKMATKIALDAIQLHGGYGYSREFPVERMMRDNKLNEIGAGTNEVMIMIIAKNLLKDALAH